MTIRSGQTVVEALTSGTQRRVGRVEVEALTTGSRRRTGQIVTQMMQVSLKRQVGRTHIEYMNVNQPDVPTGLQVTGKDYRSISLAWNANATGIAPTDYEIDYNGTKVLGGLDLVQTLVGLTPDTEYTIKIRARYFAAWSDWSAPVVKTTDKARVSRHYLITAASLLSPAIDAQWQDVEDLVRRQLTIDKNAGVPAGAVGDEAVTGIQKILMSQHIALETLPAGELKGYFQMVANAYTTFGITGPTYLRALVKVVSGDGTVIRGTLFSGVGATLLPNSTDACSRTIEGPLTPVMAQAGDRIVLELGADGAMSTATNASVVINSGNSGAADLPFEENNTNTALRPWMQLTIEDSVPNMGLGSGKPTALYLGNNKVDAAYLGSTKF